MTKVFVEGNRQEGYEIPDTDLLRRATISFAESKQTEEIGNTSVIQVCRISIKI